MSLYKDIKFSVRKGLEPESEGAQCFWFKQNN